MLLFDVTTEFNVELNSLLRDRPDLLRACLDNPRKALVLQNLCRELLGYETKFKAKLTPESYRKGRKTIIFEVAKLYANSVIIKAAQARKEATKEKSELEKLEDKANEAKEYFGDKLIQSETLKSV